MAAKKTPKQRLPKFKVYRDDKGEYRWTLYSTNGRVLADSGEGYKKYAGALKAIDKVTDAVATAEIVDG
jgi:uncharacterized protein YegP (UPF0339 family)